MLGFVCYLIRDGDMDEVAVVVRVSIGCNCEDKDD